MAPTPAPRLPTDEETLAALERDTDDALAGEDDVSTSSPPATTPNRSTPCELTFDKPFGNEPPTSLDGAPLLSATQAETYEQIMKREETAYFEQLAQLYKDAAGKPATIDTEVLEEMLNKLAMDDDSIDERLRPLQVQASEHVQHALEAALGATLATHVRSNFAMRYFYNCGIVAQADDSPTDE